MNKYNLKESLGFKLELASRLTTSNLSRKMKEDNFPITPEQWGIINFLSLEDGITQNQISTLIRKDHTCVSRLIENLIKKEIVEKNNSPVDRRINLIYLTEKGRSLHKEAILTATNNLDRAFSGVTENEKYIFSKVLDKIIENLE